MHNSQKLLDAFSALYPQVKEIEQTFCPYRACPLGAHVDHQYGLITGFAIDKGIHIAFVP
ncbi:MAG: GHMP kinase, partial [Clostridia bacterium]|nr:GHMP kinase [Clostridia bacterium]